MRYIHQLGVWPKFIWDSARLAGTLGEVRNRQGYLLGRMEALGFSLRAQAQLDTLTSEIIKSGEIEGERLPAGQVRSSLARRLGMNIGGLIPSDRYVDGVVEMMLDAAGNYNKPLTKDRLFGWQTCLFPAGRSGMRKIVTGVWRDDRHGPMRVVSGPAGRERVHFEAPDAVRLGHEMRKFLDWFNGAKDIDPVLKAAVAHLWFVTIHPFEDGNGRIARAIADMQLARADASAQRFYSMSAQIRRERSDYYKAIERAQKNTHSVSAGIDITDWLQWFLACLGRALGATETTLAGVFKKARFWERHGGGALNERQRLMINKLFDGFVGKLTSSKWAKIAKCSQDTALRDILELTTKGILVKDEAGGRSTCYSLKDSASV